MMAGSEPPDMGTAIYRIDNVSTTQRDTGVKLADTDKSYTILTEFSFPNAVISGNSWKVGTNFNPYAVGTLDNVQSGGQAAGAQIGQNFFRIRYFDKASYQYANTETAPFFSSTGRHRFAHWHEAGSGTASANMDGYITRTTASGTFTATNDTLLVIGNASVNFHTMLVYDKLLTEQEISSYISDGIIP